MCEVEESLVIDEPLEQYPVEGNNLPDGEDPNDVFTPAGQDVPDDASIIIRPVIDSFYI